MNTNLQNRIDEQLKVFQNGIPRYKLRSQANLSSGIIKPSSKEMLVFEQLYESSNILAEKFVPASGAATRMFKDLLTLKKTGITNPRCDVFFSRCAEFPFGLAETQPSLILKEVLDQRKLDRLPKGLLPFHKYEDNIRTAAEEHLVEGIGYARKKGEVRMHFTVSPEHINEFESHLSNVSSKYAVNFNITFSTQRTFSDTITVDLNNELVTTENGEPVLRPAGHGALLENLNEREADLLFVKNIDNVVPDRLKQETIKYKKVLGGILLHYQEKVFDLLKRNEDGEKIFELGRELLLELGVKGNLSNTLILEKLKRPIRVCGMVKNEGEPGGGPFWVEEKNGVVSLQIVESAQIDLSNSDQLEIFEQSTHFNPVDLVCGIKDFKGVKFDLMKYRDPDTGFISEKSYQGKQIKALELPGLWNGSMANWNTIFVEVPLITFNPVKTVNDLLKPEHQP